MQIATLGGPGDTVSVLAKRYGDRNSPRFVNGVLDRLMREHNGERQST